MIAPCQTATNVDYYCTRRAWVQHYSGTPSPGEDSSTVTRRLRYVCICMCWFCFHFYGGFLWDCLQLIFGRNALKALSLLYLRLLYGVSALLYLLPDEASTWGCERLSSVRELVREQTVCGDNLSAWLDSRFFFLEGDIAFAVLNAELSGRHQLTLLLSAASFSKPQSSRQATFPLQEGWRNCCGVSCRLNRSVFPCSCGSPCACGSRPFYTFPMPFVRCCAPPPPPPLRAPF